MGSMRVALIGVGTVGTGVARLLDQAADRIERRAGRAIRAIWAVGRDPSKARDLLLPPARITTDLDRVLADPDVDAVVELMGGTTTALRVVLDALAAGKDVVTANKALLAEHGPEIFEAARRAGRAVAFEGSVGGGIPIVQALSVGLAANQILNLAAIVNGTCNFILTSMIREGISYDSALALAQELGYAEADPTLDVDGTDTAHKLAILAQLAFGAVVHTDEIPRQGIDRLQVQDLRFAGELGYTVKLLAKASGQPEGLALRVGPTLVRHGTPLADVSGPYNAIRVVGDAVGDTLFYGRGAGALPTASAVVADLIDVAVGRARLNATTRRLWSADPEAPGLASVSDVRSRYYLRFTIADRPGMLATIAAVLGGRSISIASVIQHEPGDAEGQGRPERSVPLVMMTHRASQADVDDALAELDRLDAVRTPTVCLGVED